MDLLNSGAIAQLGGGVVCHMTVPLAESRKPAKSAGSSPLHIVLGGLPDFPVSPFLSCGPIGDAAGPAPSQSEWKRLNTPMTMEPAR
jgi:hypothetical protein